MYVAIGELMGDTVNDLEMSEHEPHVPLLILNDYVETYLRLGSIDLCHNL